MKAQRSRLYDADDVDFCRDLGDDHEDRYSGIGARRSQTIGDFSRHGKLVDHYQEEEEWDGFGGEEEDYYEQDYEDEPRLQDCFRRLEQKFEWDHSLDDDIVDLLRGFDYSVDDFVKNDKRENHWLTPKKRPPPTKAPAAPKQKPGQAAKQPSMVRSQSMAPMRQHCDCHRTVTAVQDHMRGAKKHVILVIVGHVDAGKSTLMGHLLFLTGNISQSQMAKLKHQSREMGKEADCFAWVMAEDATERARGITIDVAMTQFETQNVSVTVLDAPGHRDFVPNMIAGASQADSALLVVDAANPLLDRGQAREHLLLCKALGVSSLIVAVNKMDLVEFRKDAFDDVTSRLSPRLAQLGWTSPVFIPISASGGDNLVAQSPKMSWSQGTVLDAINQLSPPAYDVSLPFVMCVSESPDVGKRAMVSGRVDSGFVCKSDWVRLIPGNTVTKVADVMIDGKSVPFAPAGRIVDLTLDLTDVNVDVGSLLTSPDTTIPVATQFKARINILQMETALLPGARLVFHRQAVDVPVMLASIIASVDRKTKLPGKKAVCIRSNTTTDVILRLNQPLPMEVATVSMAFGRFILRHNGQTVGFGSVLEVIPLEHAKPGEKE